jgi:uncharacterized protein (TIGR03086 family)
VPPDLRPATDLLARIVRGVRDDQLAAGTPCGGLAVGGLLDHVDSLAVAFAAAGAKQRLPDDGRPPVPDAGRLGDDWRDRLTARLGALADAWDGPDAWAGSTHVGGREMPAEVAGLAALDEVLVHGWDVAVATGQPAAGEEAGLSGHVQAAAGWVTAVVGANPQGSAGLFGPPVAVPEDAAPFDRLLGLTGRDPAWRPPV